MEVRLTRKEVEEALKDYLDDMYGIMGLEAKEFGPDNFVFGEPEKKDPAPSKFDGGVKDRVEKAKGFLEEMGIKEEAQGEVK